MHLSFPAATVNWHSINIGFIASERTSRLETSLPNLTYTYTTLNLPQHKGSHSDGGRPRFKLIPTQNSVIVSHSETWPHSRVGCQSMMETAPFWKEARIDVRASMFLLVYQPLMRAASRLCSSGTTGRSKVWCCCAYHLRLGVFALMGLVLRANEGIQSRRLFGVVRRQQPASCKNAAHQAATGRVFCLDQLFI